MDKDVCKKKGNLTLTYMFLPPATKLGQGYIFTGVCDSVHRGGGSWSGGVPGPGGCLFGGGTWSGGVPGGDSPSGRLLLRMVRSLLECILVSPYVHLRSLCHSVTIYLKLFLLFNTTN